MSDSVLNHDFEVLADGLAFPECPRWRDGRLWFSDMHAGSVHTLDARGGLETILEHPMRPGGLGWTPDGELLVVSMLDRRLLRYDGTSLCEVADLSHLAPWHCNDLLVDRHGRSYVGNFGFDENSYARDFDFENQVFVGDIEALPMEPTRTVLILVESDGNPRVVADGLFFPNGMALTPDGRTLIVAQTFTSRLTAFDVAEDGSLSGRRLFGKFDDATPDGICLDAEGAIWAASPISNEVLRMTADGLVQSRLSTGDNGAFGCMLGGEDGRTLFVCTAPTSDPDLSGELRGGRIESVRVDVPRSGLP